MLEDQPSIPKYTAFMHLDGQVVAHYDSEQQKVESLIEWIQEGEEAAFWEHKWTHVVFWQHWFQSYLHILMGHFNESQGEWCRHSPPCWAEVPGSSTLPPTNTTILIVSSLRLKQLLLG